MNAWKEALLAFLYQAAAKKNGSDYDARGGGEKRKTQEVKRQEDLLTVGPSGPAGPSTNIPWNTQAQIIMPHS